MEARENGPLRVALYIRVSTDEQVEHGFSIPEQRRELLAYAEREGWRVVEVIVDEGHSGAVGIRPGLDRLTELAEAGEIDVVLAKKRNRLFRNRFYRLMYERSLDDLGVALVALDDTGNRFADAMNDEFSDWYREEVTKNMTAGRMQKAREGKLIAGCNPLYGFGYTSDRNGYVIAPAEMAVVERIMRCVASGKTLHSVKRELERDGIPSPSGKPLWLPTTVRSIVMEDAYRPYSYEELAPLLTAEAKTRLDPLNGNGVVWYPRRKVKRLEPDPARNYKRPQRTSNYVRNEQIPIPVVSSGIPADLIDKARAMIANNHASRSKGYRVYELAGVARCAECGSSLSTTRRGSNGRQYFYYRCGKNQRNGLRGCAMSISFPASQLERNVLHMVLDAVKDRDELIRKAEADFESKRRGLLRIGGADAESWHARLDAIERQRANYQRAFAADALSLSDLKARTAELDADKQDVERVLAEYEDRDRKLRELEQYRDRTITLIREGRWHELGITDARARNERYREIGLTAYVDATRSVTVEWGVSEQRSMSTTSVTGPCDAGQTEVQFGYDGVSLRARALRGGRVRAPQGRGAG